MRFATNSASLATVGRLLLAALFLLAGLNKVMNPAESLAMMRIVGLEPTGLLLPATILLELAGGALVAAGQRFAVSAALVLAAYTLATNLFFHDFWAFAGLEGRLQLSLFFKNIAVIGGLLMVAGRSSSPAKP